MHVRSIPLALALLAAVCGPRGAAAAEGQASFESLVSELGSETEAARRSAFRRLSELKAVAPEALRSALAASDDRARPLLLELAARHGAAELRPDIIGLASDSDPRTAEAALRALVLLGDEAVEAGLKALREAGGRATKADGKRPAGLVRADRLLALHRQHRVERDLLAKWRRKAGSYRGRYADLASHGWYLNAVLVAMLLDIPLEDRYLVVAEDEDNPRERIMARQLALLRMAQSPRRGYRTFEKLPIHVRADDLFGLAEQALRDVGDMDLIGYLLEAVTESLWAADERAGFQPRPFEKRMGDDIAVVLFHRGRPHLLEQKESRLRQQVEAMERRLARTRSDSRTWYLPLFKQEAGELAGTLHSMGRYDEAASWYVKINAAVVEMAGEPDALATYNRACALALGGHKEKALDELDAALALESPDLSREWVSEDGDLRSLHDDPRFAKILAKHFGE